MLRKLKLKIIAIIMSIVTVMLCVIFVGFIYLTSKNIRQQRIEHMEHIAKSNLSVTHITAKSNPYEGLPYYLIYLDKEGNITYLKNHLLDLTNEEVLLIIKSIDLSADRKSDILYDFSLRYYYENAPFGKSVVLIETIEEMSTFQILIRNSILIGAFSLIVFLCLSIIFSRWAIKPIEYAWEEQKRFTADVSHELKTPLTVILTNTQMIQSNMCSRKEEQELISSSLVMANQMRGLVENMLDISTLDAFDQKDSYTEVSFSDIANEELMIFEPIFFESGLRLIQNVEDQVNVSGRDDMLRRVLEILLDNASKYAIPGTDVLVHLAVTEKKYCMLEVRNVCESISEEEISKLFSRFYRRDKARTMNKSYGLGLSIAQKTVDNLGGTIWAANSNDTISFYVKLPLYCKTPF